MSSDDVGPIAGWYGKSPSTGDFVSRRLPKPAIDALDDWLQAGMTALQRQAPEAWPSRYATAPVWNALLPAGVVTRNACIAVVAPSFDRVGRRFPFCMVVALPAGDGALAYLGSLPDACAALSTLVERSIRMPVGADELDQRLATLMHQFFPDQDAKVSDVSDIAAVLGDAALANDLTTVPLSAHASFPWPDLVRTFDPTGSTSYWWSSAQPRRLQSGFTHSGRLDAMLFVTLFGREPEESWRTEPPG